MVGKRYFTLFPRRFAGTYKVQQITERNISSPADVSGTKIMDCIWWMWLWFTVYSKWTELTEDNQVETT